MQFMHLIIELLRDNQYIKLETIRARDFLKQKEIYAKLLSF